jgi:hypothetical protein
MCKLENGPESLDQIVSYEFQLQAAYQVTAGNLIGSLRKISRLQWQDRFEQISIVESTLRGESTGVYPLLDFSSRDVLRKRVEKLARRMRVPENLVAQQAVELASKNYSQVSEKGKLASEASGFPVDLEELPRRAFTSYYLLEPDGIKEMQQALKVCSTPGYMPEMGILRRATGTYFAALLSFIAVALTGFAAWIAGGASFSISQWVLIIIALLLPASEWAVIAVHWLIGCVRQPRPLLRYDFSHGVPLKASTMVVVPVIWSSIKEVEEMLARLELHYLANRDSNIHFALLGDYADADEEILPEDAAVLAAARAGIEEFNRRYYNPGGSTFHLFQRRRLWNPFEGVWMGWERKRGKLVEFVDLIRGRTDTTYNIQAGDSAVLSRIRYIITLDSDTQLPLGQSHPSRRARARGALVPAHGIGAGPVLRGAPM